MAGRLSQLAAAAALAGLAGLAVTFSDEFANVPRIRVGPLYTTLPQEDRIVLYVLGNSGSGEEGQRQVAQAMEARCQTHPAGAILLLGDNFDQGGVTSVEDPQWRQKVLEPYGSPCLDQLPIFPVLGNQDYQRKPSVQIEYSLINPRWRFPNRFYSVRFGSLLRLVAFDSQMAEVCFRPGFCSFDFLLEATERRDASWTVVMAHHSLATASTKGFVAGGGLRGWLLKPWMCERADLWLAAGAHHLEHRKDDCRLEQFVSGAGGGELSGVLPDDGSSRFSRSSHGFLELEVSLDQWTGRFIDASGQILYETSRDRLSHDKI